MLIDWIQIILLLSTIILAILTIETQNLLHTALCLCGMSITIGVLFGILNAPYVMVFQLLIYAGATVALFVFMITLTKRETKE